MKIKNINSLEPRRRFWQCSAMLKSRSPFFIFHFSFFIIIAAATAAPLPLESFEPADWFDTAVVIPSVGLKNLHETDAIYSLQLPPAGAGQLLKITIEATLSPSNSVWIYCGTADDDALRLGIEAGGQFTALVENQVRPFDAKLPPLPSGDHTYRLNLVTDLSRLTSAFTAFQDGAQVAHTIPPIPPSAWQGAGDPAAWTLLTASLRGKGATLRRISCSIVPRPTVIIIR